MDQNLLVMKFNDLDITIYGTHEDPLFKAKDIGVLLDMKDINSTIRDFDEDHKCMHSMHTLGGIKFTTFLTEFGLYKVLMISRKPVAKSFQRWVFSAIKEIRLTGKYELQKSLEKDKKLIREKTLIDSYHKKPVVYLGSIGKIDGLDFAKFGYTNDIKSRNTDHKREIGDCYVLEYVVECEQNIELERKLKDHNDISNRRVTKTINGKVQTELIRLDEHLQIDDVPKIVTKLKQTVRVDKEYQRMIHEETKMKHEETMAKLKHEETMAKLKYDENMVLAELKRKELETQLKILEIEALKLQGNTTSVPIEKLSTEVSVSIETVPEKQTVLQPSNKKTSVPIETLKENITEYIEEQCDFEKRNTTYRMSSEKMFHSFCNWRDIKYDVQHVVKKEFLGIINELTGNVVLPKIRINNHKIFGWYGIQYKTTN